jgi:hypothetical protein
VCVLGPGCDAALCVAEPGSTWQNENRICEAAEGQFQLIALPRMFRSAPPLLRESMSCLPAAREEEEQSSNLHTVEPSSLDILTWNPRAFDLVIMEAPSFQPGLRWM